MSSPQTASGKCSKDVETNVTRLALTEKSIANLRMRSRLIGRGRIRPDGGRDRTSEQRDHGRTELAIARVDARHGSPFFRGKGPKGRDIRNSGMEKKRDGCESRRKFAEDAAWIGRLTSGAAEDPITRAVPCRAQRGPWQGKITDFLGRRRSLTVRGRPQRAWLDEEGR